MASADPFEDFLMMESLGDERSKSPSAIKGAIARILECKEHPIHFDLAHFIDHYLPVWESLHYDPRGRKAVVEALASLLASDDLARQKDGLQALGLLADANRCFKMMHDQTVYETTGAIVNILTHTDSRGIASLALQTLTEFVIQNEPVVELFIKERVVIRAVASYRRGIALKDSISDLAINMLSAVQSEHRSFLGACARHQEAIAAMEMEAHELLVAKRQLERECDALCLERDALKVERDALKMGHDMLQADRDAHKKAWEKLSATIDKTKRQMTRRIERRKRIDAPPPILEFFPPPDGAPEDRALDNFGESPSRRARLQAPSSDESDN